MLLISILLLISVSINCEDSVVIPRDWCPIVKPNGTYKGLRIYHRFLDINGSEEYVMFNSAGDEWLFKLGYNGSEYDINILDDTLKHNTSEGVDYRFGIYFKEGTWLSRAVSLDCAVRQIVKTFILRFLKL